MKLNFLFVLSIFLISSFAFGEPSEELYPIFTKMKYYDCPECNKEESKVAFRTFYVEFFEESKELEKHSPKNDSIWMACKKYYDAGEIEETYVKFIRKMRKPENDSSYFVGSVRLNIKTNDKGLIDTIFFEKSTTHNPQFDEAIKNIVSQWTFEGFGKNAFFQVSFKFARGKNWGEIEIRNFYITIPGGAAACTLSE